MTGAPTAMIEDNRGHVKEKPVSYKMLWCAGERVEAPVVPTPFSDWRVHLEGRRRPGAAGPF